MNVTKEDFVSEAAFEEYEHTISLFWLELVFLNTTIFIMERVAEFPWHLFRPLNKTLFDLIMANGFSSAILTITKLASDKVAATLTFGHFQNRLREDLVRPASIRALGLDSRFRQLRILRKSVEGLLRRVKQVRDEYTAHLSQGLVHPEEAPSVEPVNLSDLVRLRDVLNQVFQILTLNDHKQFSMLFWDYADSPTQLPKTDQKTDIERILDNIAWESNLLHAPERDPLWESGRRRLSEDEIAQFNHYREKFGLPPV